jgi:hypothetical protein
MSFRRWFVAIAIAFAIPLGACGEIQLDFTPAGDGGDDGGGEHPDGGGDGAGTDGYCASCDGGYWDDDGGDDGGDGDWDDGGWDDGALDGPFDDGSDGSFPNDGALG